MGISARQQAFPQTRPENRQVAGAPRGNRAPSAAAPATAAACARPASSNAHQRIWPCVVARAIEIVGQRRSAVSLMARIATAGTPCRAASARIIKLSISTASASPPAPLLFGAHHQRLARSRSGPSAAHRSPPRSTAARDRWPRRPVLPASLTTRAARMSPDAISAAQRARKTTGDAQVGPVGQSPAHGVSACVLPHAGQNRADLRAAELAANSGHVSGQTQRNSVRRCQAANSVRTANVTRIFMQLPSTSI